MKGKKIYQLAKEYLGERCLHPYHTAQECSYLELQPEAVKRFAKWLERKFKKGRS